MEKRNHKILEFKMDSRWEGYEKPYTQYKFEEIANTLINPSPEVPDVVKKKLITISCRTAWPEN